MVRFIGSAKSKGSMYRIDRGFPYSRLGKKSDPRILESRPIGVFLVSDLGVPIPVFYDEDGEPLLDPNLISFWLIRLRKRALICGFHIQQVNY